MIPGMKPIHHLDGLIAPQPRIVRLCKDSCLVAKYTGWLLLVVALYVLILVAYTPTEF